MISLQPLSLLYFKAHVKGWGAMMELSGDIWAMGQFPGPRLPTYAGGSTRCANNQPVEDEYCKGKFSMLTPLRGAQPIIKFWIRQP